MSNPALPTFASWNYRETGTPPQIAAPAGELLEVAAAPAPTGIAEAEVAHRIQAALLLAKEQWDAAAQEEQHIRNQKLMATLQDFAAQRTRYFRQVEAEVVNLTLAVARKILRREASVDPTLLCGLIRIALDDINVEGGVRLRLSPADALAWKASILSFSITLHARTDRRPPS